MLLRHGQAAFGSDHYDTLSLLGEAQARATGDYFTQRGWQFDKVYCGPRQRHSLTATLATNISRENCIVEPRLDEFSEGSTILASAEERAGLIPGGSAALPSQDRMRAYMGEIRLWIDNQTHFEGAPSAVEFNHQITDWLTSVTGSPAAGQHLLAVTSAGVIAAVLCRIHGLPLQNIATIMGVIGNASFTTLLFSQGRCTLQAFNVTAHLPRELLTSI